MFRRDEVTSRVTLVELNTGDPAYVILKQKAPRPDGKERTFLQKVPLVDKALISRLSCEVKTGEEISAVLVTEWSKDGYSTYLADFQAVSSSNISASSLTAKAS